MSFTEYAGHKVRPTAGKIALMRESYRASDGNLATQDRRNASFSLAFLLDPHGTWVRIGTPEANHRIERVATPPTLLSAIETGGAIAVEYSRTGVRVQLNPTSVSLSAVESLRPRLSVVELPVALAFPPVNNTWETAASGAIAVRAIDAKVRSRNPILPAAAAPRIGKGSGGAPATGTGSYVVSAIGQWFKESDQGLKDAIGLADPALDSIGYAVRNMGFIRVSFSNVGDATITLHPRNAEAGAISAAAQHLRTLGSGRFHVRHLGSDGWVSEILPDGASAARKIDLLCNLDAATPQSRWHLTPVGLETLSADESNPLRLMHQKWRIAFGTFDESVFGFALRFNLLDRLILTGAKRGKTDLVFRYIGDGMGSMHSEEFRFNAIGNSVLQQPDKEYAEWVAKAYGEVAFSGVPRLDKIDAFIPISSRGPWLRYERLLLPWRLPTGDVLVSMNSRITSDRLLRRPE